MAKPNRSENNELGVKEYPVIQNLLYCLKSTTEHYPLLLLWCGVSIIINVLLPIFIIYLPKAVIDDITLGNSARNLIITVLSYSVCISVLSGLKRFMEKFTSFQKHKMNTYYTHKVANKGMTTDYCNQEKEQFRKLQSESFNSCNGHNSPMTQVYGTGVALFSNLFGFIVYFGILVKLNIFVVLFIAATTFISYFLNKRVIKWASDNNKKKIGYGQKTNYINSVAADIKSAKDIRLYNMSSWLEDVYNNNIKGLSGWYRRYAVKVFNAAAADGGLSLLREGTAYAYLLYLVLNSRIGVSDFVLYFAVITGFSGWLGGILSQINALNRISLAFDYLRAFLEYPETFKKQGGIETFDILKLPKKIELRSVSYKYEGASEDTLKNISLIIDPAEHLAVVGLNGAGKTTLVKLICGLCDPTDGVVLYDGIDIKEYNRVAYYRLFPRCFSSSACCPLPLKKLWRKISPEKLIRKE